MAESCHVPLIIVSSLQQGQGDSMNIFLTIPGGIIDDLISTIIYEVAQETEMACQAITSERPYQQ
jgi:hypothetical protein